MASLTGNRAAMPDVSWSFLGSLDRSVYSRVPRDELKLELDESKKLAAHARAKSSQAAQSGNPDEIKKQAKNAELYSQHADELAKVLKHKKNGNIIARNYEKFGKAEKALFYAAVISELASVPLLIVNIWAMLHKRTQPFITEGVKPNQQFSNPLIAQNPIVPSTPISTL